MHAVCRSTCVLTHSIYTYAEEGGTERQKNKAIIDACMYVDANMCLYVFMYICMHAYMLCVYMHPKSVVSDNIMS